MTGPSDVEVLLRSTLPEVGELMKAAFDAVAGTPEPDSALDQHGLVDGVAIVHEYLDVGELGVALEHLLYMIQEPGLVVSQTTYAAIAEAGTVMGLPTHTWEGVRRRR